MYLPRPGESVLHMVRFNKDGQMALLKVFLYDPLLNWPLLDENKKTSFQSSWTKTTESLLEETLDLLTINACNLRINEANATANATAAGGKATA